MAIKKVALLTAGGLAPCLSTAIGRLIERYTEVSPETEIIAYIGGYKGLLQGNAITVTDEIRKNAAVLYKHGGSPIGKRPRLSSTARRTMRRSSTLCLWWMGRGCSRGW